jgi:hypothetical protein
MIEYVVNVDNFILNFHKALGWFNVLMIPSEIFLILIGIKAMRCDVKEVIKE